MLMIRPRRDSTCSPPTYDCTKPNLAFLKAHFCYEGLLAVDRALFIIRRGT